MYFSELGVKRFQSENLKANSSLACPLPTKKQTRLNDFLAKEILGSSSSEENDLMGRSSISQQLSKIRCYSVQAETDSVK
jgi:hypothetical protein